MKDTNKRWFHVEGDYSAFFGFKVQASDAKEAEAIFWESDIDVEQMQHHVHNVTVFKVTECDGDKP
jgi:hypothetical protein